MLSVAGENDCPLTAKYRVTHLQQVRSWSPWSDKLYKPQPAAQSQVILQENIITYSSYRRRWRQEWNVLKCSRDATMCSPDLRPFENWEMLASSCIFPYFSPSHFYRVVQLLSFQRCLWPQEGFANSDIHTKLSTDSSCFYVGCAKGNSLCLPSALCQHTQLHQGYAINRILPRTGGLISHGLLTPLRLWVLK